MKPLILSNHINYVSSDSESSISDNYKTIQSSTPFHGTSSLQKMASGCEEELTVSHSIEEGILCSTSLVVFPLE